LPQWHWYMNRGAPSILYWILPHRHAPLSMGYPCHGD
jgi:hypothetical protein